MSTEVLFIMFHRYRYLLHNILSYYVLTVNRQSAFLDRYLEQRDPPVHAQAKRVIKMCYERNKNGDPAYTSLTASMKVHLKAAAGEAYWRQTQNYLDHFRKHKEKERARAARQQPQALPASRSAPIPSFVEGGLGAPAGYAISLKKDSKPKSLSLKKDPEPQSGGEKETGVKEYVVCLEAPRTHVFVPCGHMCTCKSCSSRLMEDSRVCPMCNQSSTMAIKVFVP